MARMYIAQPPPDTADFESILIDSIERIDEEEDEPEEFDPFGDIQKEDMVFNP